MRVQSKGRQPSRVAEPAECLVELGGWCDHLSPAELRAVAGESVEFIGHRLARVKCAPDDLLRLGAGRAVHAYRGFSELTSRVPDELAAHLQGPFAVRFHDRGRLITEPERRRVVSLTWRAHPSPAVDLQNPAHEIHVFAEAEGLWFGERIGECAPELRSRRGRRPFFRSYETPARKARVLVNLAGAGPGLTFIDPFCGTGALVFEAERVGCRAIGSDLDPRAAVGAARNASYESADVSFLIADGRRPPYAPERVHCAATDLPYGRSASRRGSAGHRLYHQALDGLVGTTETGVRVVVMSLETDRPCGEPDGWSLDWECREAARTVVRSIRVWRRT